MLKRVITSALAASIIVASIPAYAAMSTPGSEPDIPSNLTASDLTRAGSNDDKALEEAILKVKSRVSIPAEYSNFNFNKGTRYGQSSYSLSWEKDGDTYGSIRVTITGDVISEYNHYFDKEDNNTAHFAKMSNTSLYNKAVSYIKSFNPSLTSKMVVNKDSFNSYIGGTNASFTISRIENGVSVNGDGGSITLNKDTGELIRFSVNWANGFTGKDPADALSQKEIKDQYSKLVGLEPYYSFTYDKDGNKSAILLYRAKSGEKLDAFTGKISKFELNYYGGMAKDGEYEDDDDMAADEGAGTNSSAPKLTPEELKAVEIEKGFITATEAANVIFKDKYNNINSSEMELSSSNLYQVGKDNNEYRWVLNFQSKDKTNRSYSSASINAKTSEIFSYNKYNYITYDMAVESGVKFSEKTSDTNVNAALKSYLGSKYSQYKIDNRDVTSVYAPSNSSKDSAIIKSIPTGKSYSFVRYVNGIRVDGDTINVTTDINGSISNFSYSYSDISFPSISRMLSEEKALQALYKNQDLDLEYFLNVSTSGNVSSVLLYSMPDFLLDAFTGKLVNWDGSLKSGDTGYSDLEGHSIKAIAEKLYQNGISLPAINGKLNPDDRITEADYINLLNSISTDWSDFYYLYQRRISTNGGNIAISRQNAVKAMIISLGGKKFAETKDVFSSPYKDVANDNAYVGYFALSHGMKITNANSEGNILPTNAITRAYALRMVYNYLNNN